MKLRPIVCQGEVLGHLVEQQEEDLIRNRGKKLERRNNLKGRVGKVRIR